MRTYKKFIISFTIGGLILLALIFTFLYVGAESIGAMDVLNGIFNYDENNFNQTIVRDIRLPRLIADIMVGGCLALSGCIMQGTTKNPMADSGLMGISSGSVFAVVIIVAFFPGISRLGRIAFSSLGALFVTAIIYGIAIIGRKTRTAERMILSGMAISTLFSSLTTAFILKEGISGEMLRYTAGSSANTIWTDVYVALPFFILGILIALLISRSLTIMNLGDEVGKGLGANVNMIRVLSTLVVLVLSAIAVVIIGPVGYIGLMVPHIARKMVGTDYRFIIPITAIFGAIFVLSGDMIARTILIPFEFPIGVIITMIGVPFFIYVSRRQELEGSF